MGESSMDFFQLLSMAGGLALFLFGMDLMGQALERRAGDGLRDILGRLTTGRAAGLLTGLGVTAVIQSSSAATVMVVGFVNSGLMTLRQAIHVIMGANIGTTVTPWLLSLSGLDGGNLFVRLLKPSSFTPILAVVGIVLYMAFPHTRRRDTGVILLGFATLMTGMETMSGAVSGLGDAPGFRQLFVLFQNPLLGLLAGAVLTAIIQSSSASVGILQALAATGRVSYAAAVPIIMGQNIGTCATTMLSSIGANQNAKRAALVHLSFNTVGSALWLAVFWAVKAVFHPPLLDAPATLAGIAAVHTGFNLLCTLLLLPLTGFFEGLVTRLVPDGRKPEPPAELDPRLLAAPPVALERCRAVAGDMARNAAAALREGMAAVRDFSPALAASVRQREAKSDHYEDILSSYLVQLSARPVSAGHSAQAARLLKLIGDWERISDHGENLVESAEELHNKGIHFTPAARRELEALTCAVDEIIALALSACLDGDRDAAARVAPLEEVIDQLKEQLRTSHILRLQRGGCTIEAGFVWSDLLTDLERAADHCSNIAENVLGQDRHGPRQAGPAFREHFQLYLEKYAPDRPLPPD